ncbi:DUF6479 family protein [Streptomyces sp. NPDC017993]|uniref:DUF6479 family protein n=1 Tax=Streptomyces sp. NPDC017993 TaxID=3365027 RepID=UPI0037ADE783
MDTSNWELAATQGMSAMSFVVVGLVIVGVLIAAFIWGRRKKAREPGPPLPQEQPRLPADGPVRQVMEEREPDPVPQREERLTPHELKGTGTIGSRPGPSQERRQ